MLMLKRSGLLFTIAALGLTSCDGGLGPEDGAMVSIQFRAGSFAVGSVNPAPASLASATSSSLSIPGSNGTLILDDVRFIVAEFELERADSDEDCDDALDGDACEEFDAPPQFVQLELDGSSPPVVTQAVDPDVYDELEFEVEDLDLDDEVEENGADLAALFQTILTEIPDWPEEASLLVVGSFTPTGGDPIDFRVFFEAEIEIEIEFEPPLDLTADPEATVTVVVDPSLWFAQPDGTVLDLSQFQGQLVEFEAEFENGITEIEFDD